MDLYMTGFFALGGTLLGGLITYFVQRNVQRNEHVRHMRKLAFDAAIVAWREQVESGEHPRHDIQPLQDFIVAYLVFADAALQNIGAHSTIEDLRRVLRTTRDQAYFLREYRDQLIKEPRKE